MFRNTVRQGMLQRTLRFLCVIMLLSASALSYAATYVSVTIAPPLLPVYAQPLIPAPGYIWIPGYWAYGPEGYYWVPGTWVLPPSVGLLWTPGYWGWSSGAYLWNAGYWGPRVGYYGGVNYGFGYFGTGYQGGYWRGGSFYYNRAVNNVNVTSVHTTYNTTVNTTTVNRVAYSGGPGGIQRQPTAVERQAMNERHVEATPMQLQHQNAAAQNRALFASENHGRPAIAATPQPGAFNQPGVVPARESQATTNRSVTTAGTAGAPATNRAATVASPPTNRHRNGRGSFGDGVDGRHRVEARAQQVHGRRIAITVVAGAPPRQRRPQCEQCAARHAGGQSSARQGASPAERGDESAADQCERNASAWPASASAGFATRAAPRPAARAPAGAAAGSSAEGARERTGEGRRAAALTPVA